MPEPREILGDYVFALIQDLSRRKDVPDVVIDDVFAIKKIADRVDGRIHANTICMVLISHGYSADDNKYGFERGEWPKDAGTKDETSIEGAGALTNPVKDEEKVEDVETPATKEDAPTETKTEDEAAASSLSDIDEGLQPLANDTAVTFIHEGKYVDGKIVSSEPVDEEIFYDIEVDGIDDPLTIHEDDVNVKK